ncbi:MAG: HAD-superfamily hydrolase subfamily variant 3, partial [Armatimonadetes bacterium]|nr:HAD-superfamily hydrolase subfamily variant 3 [Armatimonadota bacterium]
MTPRSTLHPTVRLLSSAALLSVVLVGCGPVQSPDETPPARTPPRGPAPITVSQDPWVLGVDSWGADARPAYLGNGYLGQRFSPTGTGISPAGDEPSFLAGCYVNESIKTVSALLPVRIHVGEVTFGGDTAKIKPFHQELRLAEGILRTTGTWDTGSGSAEVEIETALLRQQPDLALARIRIKNQGKSAVTVSLPEALSGGTAEDDLLVENSLTSLSGATGTGNTYEVAAGG